MLQSKRRTPSPLGLFLVVGMILGTAGCAEDQVIDGNPEAQADATQGSDVSAVDGGGLDGGSDSASGTDVSGGTDTAAGTDAATEDADADAAPLCTADSCDDKNPCTDDKCDAQKGCSNTPNSAACDDGDACTSADACKEGKCAAGAAKDCDDKNPCTKDSCDSKTGCVASPDDTTPCSDGDGCTDGDKCKDGKCGSGAALTCDDKNPCTDDTCDPAKGCAFANNTAPCTDENACTQADACAGGSCTPGVAIACNDGNPCTDDSCDSASGGCVTLPNAATCDDGDSCTGGDACATGACKGAPGLCGCKTAAECNDSNPCTEDSCSDGKCGAVNLAEGASCSDGDVCTSGDACKSGSCKGAASVCDDKNPCTDDICAPGLGCTAKDNTAACDDGNACTSGDKCKQGACAGDTGSCACKADSDCDDKNACTDDACVAGKCNSKPAGNGKACEDGNACTQGDSCQNSACVPGKAASCDDQNPCTNDACDTQTGKCATIANSAPCNDGDACSTGDVCKDGKCGGPGVLMCDDKNPCTEDTCDKIKACSNDNLATGTECAAAICDGLGYTSPATCAAGMCVDGVKSSCDDGNPCTDDACNVKGGCKSAPNTVPCSDGSVCTKGDSCKTGTCNPGELVACDDGNPCTIDACDPVKGCVATNTSDGAACKQPSCGQGGFDAGSQCSAGVCTAIAPVKSCDDKNPCTDDQCSPASGCISSSNSASCDDGDACTEGDECASGKCTAGNPVKCDDDNPCSDDSCDSKIGCKNAANTAPCDDGSVCTKGDACKDKSCGAGAEISCDDKNPCTDEFCDAAKGCVSNFNDAACDDGNACTDGDVCDGSGGCKGTVAGVNCDDKNPCTIDTCDTAGGCVNKNAADGAACSNGTCASDGFVGAAVCAAGKCGALPAAKSCDDKNPCTTDLCNPVSGCSSVPNTASCDDGDACTKSDTCAASSCAGSAVTCQDDNPCTDDSCNSKSGCVFAANKASCDDDNACTKEDVCASSKCAGPTVVFCDDKNPCTTDSCDAIKGCQFTNNTQSCDDKDACTSGDLCGGGVCSGSTKVTCDDKNVCTTDSCDPAKGCQYAANTAACDDGNLCTSADTCSGGKCAGSAIKCDDKNGCTSDSCESASGCVFAFTTAACDDGNACTTADGCKLGSCLGGAAPSCDDKNPCTTDSCDSLKGCVNANNTLPCDDGTVCTQGDVCAAGKCVPGAAVSCDDKNVCTDDSCDPVAGCKKVNNTKPCDDGNACNSGDSCKNGQCAGTGGVDCNDGNPCTTDTCDSTGGCVNKVLVDGAACSEAGCTGGNYQGAAVCTAGKCGALPALKLCDDKNVCTTDFCDALKGCTSVVNTAGCSDGNACTKSDICSGGACSGTTISCNDGNPCTDDSCESLTGCEFTNNFANCDDNNACTSGDKCGGGSCKGGSSVICDDNKVCTDNSCDSVKGCTYANNTVNCDDGNACTTADKCLSGVCLGGAAPDCDDKNPCTNDACDKLQGCVHSNNTSPCDDLNACTTSDTCSAGACKGGAAPNCDDSNPCTVDSCDKLKGCVNTAVADNTKCGDPSCSTLVFQATSTCQAGKCIKPSTQNCDDSLECTVDTCQAASGCGHSNKPWGTACTNNAVSYSFCAASLCTGVEKISAQVGGSNIGAGQLNDIDRFSGGNMYSAGMDSGVNPRRALMANVVESPALGLQFNAALGYNSAMLAQRHRLAVGGRTDDGEAYSMVFDAVTGFWKAGPNITDFDTAMRALDMYVPTTGTETYVMGGNSSGGGNGNEIGRLSWNGSAWSNLSRMVVSTSKSTCTPVNVSVLGIYAAAPSAVFLTGLYSQSGVTRTGVAFWDGNTANSCDGIDNISGVAYVDTAAYTQSFTATVNTGAVPAMGVLGEIHGTSAKNVMAAGSNGTIVAYDGTKWAQIIPAYSGMPLAWSNGFAVGGVYLTGNEAWLTGTIDVTGVTTCRQLWLLHGVMVNGAWTWNKQIIAANNDLAICSNDSNVRGLMQANAVWVDNSTGSVYVVGSRGGNGLNQPVVTNVTRQLELVLRIKTK